MSEILTNGVCSRCGCFVGEALGHVCFVQDSATHAPVRIHLIDETVTLLEELAALRARAEKAERERDEARAELKRDSDELPSVARRIVAAEARVQELERVIAECSVCRDGPPTTPAPEKDERKYRKKPVVIEAMRVPGSDDLIAWGALAVWLGPGGPWTITDKKGLAIRTLEGTMVASPGDWIIRGVKGELYPCKNDIFEATYEKA